MSFLWPDSLWLLLAVPLLVGLYVVVLRRRKKLALRYASLSMVREAIGVGQRARRHVPPILFLIGLTLMIVAMARPTALVTLPTQHETIILEMDVSGSMRAVDVQPTRRATAIGSGILVSLKAIFPDVEFDLRASNPRIQTSDTGKGLSLDNKAKGPPKDNEKPVAPGSYQSAAIILLTDGQTTTGPDPVEAARMAADRGVRIYTVGIGTVQGEIIGWEGWSMRVRLDEDTLKTIANITRGEYFYAGTATDLKKVYQGMNSKMVLQKQQSEITALFVAAAAVFVLLGAGFSLAWFNRLL